MGSFERKDYDDMASVKEIEKKYMAAMDEYKSLIARQAEMRQKAERLNDEAEAAAVSGNIEQYKALKAEASDAEAAAYVMQKRIEKSGAEDVFSREEVMQAWDNYAADYNKQLKGMLKKFYDTKAELLLQYSAMVEAQRAACATREKIGAYIGLKINPLIGGIDNRFDGLMPMKYIPCMAAGERGTLSIRGARIQDADACYYLASLKKSDVDLYRDPEAQKVITVVESHHA